ncbi:hypothetical protein EKD04_009430 [Chloroflexales bacterium ZM16-3]|nr:hypothetical protein [Chloroflexales bacterium ZM16-3]
MSEDIRPDELEEERADEEMTPKALTAFEQYYALGPKRSLRCQATETGTALRQLERWSARYDWPKLARERHAEEVATARAAVRLEAATLARRRLRNAQLMQEAGLTIFSLAKLTDMDPDAARKALPDARYLLVEGMRAERLELGEASENASSIVPPKPIGEMSDEELAAFALMLEQAA